MEGERDDWGLVAESIGLAVAAAAIRNTPSEHVSDALRFMRARSYSRQSAALLDIWATCRSAQTIGETAGPMTLDPAAPDSQQEETPQAGAG